MVETRGSISLPDQSYGDLAPYVCERSFNRYCCEDRNEKVAGYRRLVMFVGGKKHHSDKIDPDPTVYDNHVHRASGYERGAEK